MPNDNIKRTIDKALGAGNTDNYEAVTYEGYGPGGVAVIVEALTDNRQRTAPEVRHLLRQVRQGNMGAQGCVSWSFDRKGVIVIDNEDGELDEDTVMMDALEAGAADFEADGPVFEITTDPDAFNDVIAALEAKGYTFASADIEMVPQNYVKLTSEEDIKNMEKLHRHAGGQRRRAERLAQLGDRGLRYIEITKRPTARRRSFHIHASKTVSRVLYLAVIYLRAALPRRSSHLRERSGRPWGAKPLLPYRCCSG